MLSQIKKTVMNLLLGKYSSSSKYIDYLRLKGIKVGPGSVIYSPLSVSIDTLNPHLLSIGNNVQITANVTILTHDYGWAVVKHLTGEILGNQKETVIGNNVFIGMRSVILCGTKIGDNVIIGAGSVVSGNIESNSVYAGNPAVKIMPLNQYIAKRHDKQLSEAIDVYKCYKSRFHKVPDKALFHEYFMLFENGTHELIEAFERKLQLVESYEKSVSFMASRKPIFENYEDFCAYAERVNASKAINSLN